MKINLIKNAKRNVLFGIVNRIVAVLCPFVTRTVIQYVLGEEYLGLSSLFQSILNVLSLAELGFSSAIVFSMYKPIAEDNIDEVNALLNYYRKAYAIIGTVIFVFGMAVVPFLPFLITGKYPEGINITFLYIIYLLNTVISYWLFAYKSSLIVVYQREDINSITNTVITLVLAIVQGYILIFYRNYYWFVIVMPLFTIANNLRIAYITKKMFPQYRCTGTISRNLIQELRKQICGAFLARFCQVARNSFDSICISAFLGLSLTAIYNNYFYIILSVGGFAEIFMKSLTGGIGNHIVTKKSSENYRELKQFDFIYMWLSGWMTICILCISQPFMEIWMGERMMLPNEALFLLCLYFYLLRLGDMKALYSNVTGLWWQHRWRSICEAVSNVILNVVLAKVWGLYGIIIATIVTMIFIQIIWGGQIVFKYYFGLDYFIDYLRYQSTYFVITLIIAAICWFTCKYIPYDGLLAILVRLLFCIIVPNIAYYHMYKRTFYIKEIKRIVQSK